MKNTGSCKYLAFCLLIAALTASGMVVPASAGYQAQAEPSGKQIVTTTVNDRDTFGIRIVSGTTVETGNAAGVLLVNLGKLGRVELSRNSKIKLSYSESFVTGSLYAGRVRVSIPEGMSANISTTDGEVVANEGGATSFTIDTSCGATVVKVKNGEVQLRAGGEVKKISAGAQGSVGTPLAGKKCPK